jgi:predicted TIM-barrel enzyme
MISLPRPILVGMCHLPPLPGSPGAWSMREIISHAARDAATLLEAGFGAIIIENFGDAPFLATRLEPWTVAAMGLVAAEVKATTDLPLGINALRNDALAALGIAAAAGADFIRVNVLVGVSATDQGIIEGPAAHLLSQPDIGLAAEETAHRGQADALIVSGSTTGRPTDLKQLQAVKQAVPDRPVLVGSGATPANIRQILEIADGAIVGSCLKPGGDCAKPVDAKLAAEFIRAAKA